MAKGQHLFPPNSKIFLYLRDSGHEDQELSVDQQESAARRWAAENGLIISRVFKDAARKGSSDVGRAELQAMMYAFRHNCEERGVVVWRYNRFARSVDNAQFYRADIRTRGYIFYSLNDNVPEGPMGRLFEAAIDFKDEQYLEDLSEDVKRGLRDLIEIHRCVPGVAPRGIAREKVIISYRRDGTPHIAHRWKPDPDLAPRVLKAFELRAAKASLGVIHKQTRLFSAVNSYGTFFKNEIYKGMLHRGDIIVENYCTAIVPPDLWDAVQAVQNDFAHKRHVNAGSPDHPRRANSRFLLGGLVFHAVCDSPLYGHSSKQKSGARYDSYLCTRAYRNRDCDRKRIPREPLEQAVIKAIDDYLLNPDFLTGAQREMSDAQASSLSAGDKARRALAAELGRLRRGISNLTDSLAQLGHSPAVADRLRDYEIQQIDLQAQLAALDANAEQPIPEIPPEVLAAISKDFHAHFDTADLETRRLLIRGFVQRVQVEREGKFLRGIVHFYYPTPPSPKTVPSSPSPSGPPPYRHIISVLFETSTKRPRK